MLELNLGVSVLLFKHTRTGNNHWAFTTIHLFARHNKCTFVGCACPQRAHWHTHYRGVHMWYRTTHFAQGIQTAHITTETRSADWGMQSDTAGGRCACGAARHTLQIPLMQMWLICSEFCGVLAEFLQAKVPQRVKTVQPVQLAWFHGNMESYQQSQSSCANRGWSYIKLG